jgi:hypothetical protein
VSEAPDGFLVNFELSGKGVAEPLDGVLVLVGTPLAGLISPVGVRGREVDDPFTGAPNFRPETLL